MLIRKARIGDLDGIKVISDAYKNELGFVLRPALAESIKREEVFVAMNASRIVGFVEYHHRQDCQTTLYHIAVLIEKRCQNVGRALLDALCEEARNRGKTSIQLKCPQGIPANTFY